MTPFRIIAVLLLLSFLGCAGHKKPLTLDKTNVARISYDTRLCHDLPDMRVSCDKVIFTRKTVSVEELRAK